MERHRRPPGDASRYRNQEWRSHIREMIHTVAKQKLPKSLAYPIGAQALTDALVGVPQLDELSLWFSRHDYGTRESDGKHICIAARYTKYNMGLSASHDLHESGFYGPKWETTVYAVPSPLNFRIRDALRDHGLAILRDWLSQRRTETWLATSHRLVLWFCSETESIIHTIENK